MEEATSARATAAAVLAMVGIGLLPALHLVLHDELAPHSHGPSADHCHGGACHDHRVADDPGPQDPGTGLRPAAASSEGAAAASPVSLATGVGADRPLPPTEHGRGSLAHQDLALALAPVGLPLALAAVLELPTDRSRPIDAPRQERVDRHRVRGPPPASS